MVDELISKPKMSISSVSCTYRGLHRNVSPERIEVSQWKIAESLATLDLKGELERELNADEQTEYRSLVGRMNWLQAQSRPYLSFGVSKAACKSQGACVVDVRELNASVRIVFRRIASQVRAPYRVD